MDIEVQVALNFVISYLYNKLPRRRVNIFGEELEKALKDKFQGHWYPEKPFKGSAFRCLKTGDPVDPVLERAAKESGVPIQDILENLPAELAVWVDPGEVSYRIGEKNMIKILYSESADLHDESSADREVTKTFNPEAQCFRPIEAVGTSLSGLSLSPKSTSPFPSSLASSASNGSSNNQSGHGSGSSSAPSPTPITNSFKGSPSPVPAFIPRSTAPLTFTTATFAQTKFGSTKLKTSSKRANRSSSSRMSPTEFSNYIKQRAMQQQIHHHHHHQHQQQQQQQQQSGLPVSQNSPTSRSLSPGGVVGQSPQAQQPQQPQQHSDPSAYFFPGPYHPQFTHRNIFDSSSHGGYLPDLYGAKFPSSYLDPSNIGHQFYGSVGTSSSQTSTNLGPIGSGVSNSSNGNQQEKTTLVDGLNNFGLGPVTPYPASQYQHLLVAN
ncbi:protein Tob1 isoform X1 [Microplitis mediator]|uniref:protein Tob1 isoform X1 n=1 Tax=Microplitis mediator TaxID=375433 RepID=UPI002556EBAB|nr:protein Tob1 isoform X1 [Microplitis mediator]XP_057320217.1 protein Tob1 isoform X1 [Microplitis mediator]XP_057320218.1 protein Tob1 isoform X1 [Microplitis mediator]